jgi:hypothetical protein
MTHQAQILRKERHNERIFALISLVIFSGDQPSRQTNTLSIPDTGTLNRVPTSQDFSARRKEFLRHSSPFSRRK